MKSVAAIIVLLSALISPVQAQSVESARVPIAILVTSDLMVIDGAGCSFADGHFPKIDAFPTPYAEPTGDWTLSPRVVNEQQSPAPGVAGCLWELEVEFLAGYDYQIQVSHSQGWWKIDAGTMSFGEITSFAPATIVFVLNQDAFDTWATTAVGSSQAEIPDYPATIEAQQTEIESLRATIEAIGTPAP